MRGEANHDVSRSEQETMNSTDKAQKTSKQQGGERRAEAHSLLKQLCGSVGVYMCV